MIPRANRRAGKITGILAIGLGALLGLVLVSPSLSNKSETAFLGPILGAIGGGILYRRSLRVTTTRTNDASDEISESTNVANSPLVAPANSRHQPAYGLAFLFLILSPIIAVFVTFGLNYFLHHEMLEGAYLLAVLFIGLFVGLVGFVGSLFLDAE